MTILYRDLQPGEAEQLRQRAHAKKIRAAVRQYGRMKRLEREVLVRLESYRAELNRLKLEAAPLNARIEIFEDIVRRIEEEIGE